MDEDASSMDERFKNAFSALPAIPHKLRTFKAADSIRRLVPVNVVSTREGDSVDFSCRNFLRFLRYSLGHFTIPILIIASVLPALLNLYVSEWLRVWVAQPESSQLLPFYRNMFMLIVGAFLGMTLLRNFIVGSLMLLQNRKLHDHMLSSVVRATLAFFDDNPASLILSRFSKDLSVGDVTMPVVSTWFSEFFFRVISVFAVLCVVVPWMLIPVGIAIILTFCLRHYLAKIMASAMKLETLTRAPVVSHFSTSLDGLVAIRAARQ